MQRALTLSLMLLVAACQKGGDKSEPAPKTTTDTPTVDEVPVTTPDATPAEDPHKPPQVTPPLDVKVPPTDAIKTPSNVLYKSLIEGNGKAPGINDGVKVRYAAWRLDGTTVAATAPGEAPTAMMLYSAPSGFVEGMMLMKAGGKAMFWMPPDLVDPTGAEPLPEQLTYSVELVEVISAPPTPPDLNKPPADATREKSGVVWKKLKTAKGEHARAWDEISLGYTGWDSTGRILESSEMNGQSIAIAVEGLPPLFADVVPGLAVGERARLWFPEAMLGKRSGADADAKLCFEVEVTGIKQLDQPPDAPPDVKAPPADALKTPKGVFYKVLTAAPAGGTHPTVADKVRVNYTGWQTNGHRFDSSIPHGEPAEWEVTEVMPGWIDALLMMTPGDHWRLWIPEELAYKGQAQRPAGMLVFDVELVEVVSSKVQFTPPP